MARFPLDLAAQTPKPSVGVKEPNAATTVRIADRTVRGGTLLGVGRSTT